MFLIRSARARDLSALYRHSKQLNSYNLLADKPFLRQLLRDSAASFSGSKMPKEKKRFLFVLEDTAQRKVIGVSQIIARHGTPRMPHIAFRLETDTKVSRTLSIRREHQTLTLATDRNGFTEIGGLVLDPVYRRRPEKLGKQLSYVRFAYMALNRRSFCKRLLVEYLPILDAERKSALWKVLGSGFTGLRYREADRLSAENKEFILSLFPREKIYCGLLPDVVSRDIGKPGPGAKASLRMLEGIGFRYLHQVDPFDGGPHYGAEFSKVSLISRTVKLKCRAVATLKQAAPVMVMSVSGEFRACVSFSERRRGVLNLPRETTRALRLKDGDAVAVLRF